MNTFPCCRNPMRRARFAVWSVCLSAVVLGSVAQANIITVNNLIDSGGSPGVCTLRAAITAANTNVASGGCGAGSPYPVLDTIQIPFTSTFCNLIGCTIVLTSPLPLVSEDVTIIGSGSGTPTISGNNLYRVLSLGPVTVNLTQLKIVSGNSGPGAGISIADPGGTVTISGVVFSGNVLLELARRGVSREQAYDWVQRNAMRSFTEQRDFKELLLADADVTAVLPAPVIEEAFDLHAHFRNVDAIFARVFGAKA